MQDTRATSCFHLIIEHLLINHNLCRQPYSLIKYLNQGWAEMQFISHSKNTLVIFNRRPSCMNFNGDT